MKVKDQRFTRDSCKIKEVPKPQKPNHSTKTKPASSSNNTFLDLR